MTTPCDHPNCTHPATHFAERRTAYGDPVALWRCERHATEDATPIPERQGEGYGAGKSSGTAGQSEGRR